MEQLSDILPELQLDSSGQEQLAGAGRWARFIGVVYLVMAILTLSVTLLLLLNLNFIANMLMEANGISQESIEFIMGAGKWIFALFMLLSVFIMGLNGYFLLHFGKHSKQAGELPLQKTYYFLGRYLMLNTILSAVSTFFSIMAFLYYFLS